MHVLIFCALRLKMPIHTPKIGVFGHLTHKMRSSYMNKTSKGTSLHGNTSYDVYRQNPWYSHIHSASQRIKQPKQVRCHMFRFLISIRDM